MFKNTSVCNFVVQFPTVPLTLLFFNFFSDPNICEHGTYSYSGWVVCRSCDPGYQCVSGSVSPRPASGKDSIYVYKLLHIDLILKPWTTLLLLPSLFRVFIEALNFLLSVSRDVASETAYLINVSLCTKDFPAKLEICFA